MKITDIVKLALKNVIGHKRIMLRVAVSVLAVVVMCSVSVAFMSAVSDKLTDLQYENIDQACAVIFVNSDTEKRSSEEANNIISKINDLTDITSCRVFYNYELYTEKEYLNSMSQSESNDDYMLKGMVLTYDYNKQKTAYLDLFDSYHDLAAMDITHDTMPENERIGFERNYPEQKIILYGNNISGDDEIILSKKFLSHFGFTGEEMEHLIGKRISLKNADTDEIYLDGFTVCGIISDEATRQVFDDHSIIISKNGAEKTELMFRYADVNLYYDSFSKAIDAEKQIEKTGIHISDGFALEKYSKIERVSDFVEKILIIILPLICISMLLSVVSALLLYYSDSMQRTAVLRAMGASAKSVYAIVFAETAIVVFFSDVVGLLLSVGTNIAFSEVLDNYFEFSLPTISGMQFITGAVSCVFVFIFVLIASFVTTMKTSAMPIDRALKSD